jgi:hypothetical protein
MRVSWRRLFRAVFVIDNLHGARIRVSQDGKGL